MPKTFSATVEPSSAHADDDQVRTTTTTQMMMIVVQTTPSLVDKTSPDTTLGLPPGSVRDLAVDFAESNRDALERLGQD